MANEYYEYSLLASAGRITASLEIRDNGEVVCDLQWAAMGNQGYRYRLYGKHEVISDAYGWFHIQRVEDMLQSPTALIPIEALEAELIYEYVKLPRSRFLQHPADILWQAARWNPTFDLILFVSDFVLECWYSLKLAIDENSLEEIYPENLRRHINDAFMEHLSHLMESLDKMKFSRMEKANQ